MAALEENPSRPAWLLKSPTSRSALASRPKVSLLKFATGFVAQIGS